MNAQASPSTSRRTSAAPSISASASASASTPTRPLSRARPRTGSGIGAAYDDDDASAYGDTPSQAGTDAYGYGASTPGLDGMSAYGGGAGSMLGRGGAGRIDLGRLNIVSWKRDVEDAMGSERGESVVDGGEEGEAAVGTPQRQRQRRPFNALSTVLSHPTRPPAPLRASRKPLPPSAFLAPPGPVVVPKPPPPGFYQPYLDGVQGMWDEWVRLQERQRAGGGGKGKERAIEEPEETEKQVVLPDLGGIPRFFFDAEFDLANPLTWEEVMGRPSDAAAGRHQPLPTDVQERLSTYLDDLESHLVHEVSIRTPSFFSALSNLQSLNAQTSSCLDRISSLRTQLRDLDDKQAIKGLRVIDRQERLRAAKEVRGAVAEVEALVHTGKLARQLGEAGDWAGALEGMEIVARQWKAYGVEPPEGDDAERKTALPLATLPSLASVPSDLSILSRQVADQLEAALSSLIISIISQAPGVASAGNSQPPSRVTSPTKQQPDPMNGVDSRHEAARSDFRDRSRPLLIGLARCDAKSRIIDVWRNCVAKAVKEGMRQHLQIDHEGEDEHHGAEDGKGHSLADILRDMSHERFLSLSGKMYASMIARIELIRALGDELLHLLAGEDLARPSTLQGIVSSDGLVGQDAHAATDIKDILVSACELANARAAKVLVARTPQHADLTLEQFVAIFKQSSAFVTASEAVSGRMIVSLRGVITSQARAFLVKYHSIRLQASAKCVEEEQWVQIDVPPATQQCVETIISSAISDQPEHRLSDKQANGHALPNGKAAAPAGDDQGKTLKIEDNTFFVVSATAKTVEMLNDYQKLMVNLELVATDVMNRVIEFLKSFNSRTCQVVLGAGAMRSAGLKNITAKHLALASQSLSIIVCLIPYMREFVRRHLNPKQAVMLVEFDKLKRDFQEHQNEIHAKLVAIMADRLAVHCQTLKAIDWEVSNSRSGPNAYAEMLVKETTTLHKVLSKYLSQQAVSIVMSQVISATRERFGDIMGKVEFKSEDAKKRMQTDVAFVVSRLKDLSDEPNQSPLLALEKEIKEKPTPKRQMSATINGLLKRGGKTAAETSEASSDTKAAEPSLNEDNASAKDAPADKGDKANLALPDLPPKASDEAEQTATAEPQAATSASPAVQEAADSQILAQDDAPEATSPPDASAQARVGPERPLEDMEQAPVAGETVQIAGNGSNDTASKPADTQAGDAEQMT